MGGMRIASDGIMVRILLVSALFSLTPSLATSASAQRIKPPRQAPSLAKKAKTSSRRVRKPRSVRHRSHLAKRLLPRLSSRARKNARATVPIVVAKRGKENQVNLGHGTGFFVTGPDAKGRALLMTNHHVVDSAAGQFAALEVKGKSERIQTRVVVSSEQLDYALVEVVLPDKTQVTPVTLAKASKGKKDKIYSVGYPSTELLGAEQLAGSDRHWKKATASEPVSKQTDPLTAAADALARSPRVIALGKDNRSQVAASEREKNTQYFDVPGAPGASGSPVFSRASHKVVGLLYGASPGKDGKTMVTAVTPMSLILKDVGGKLKAMQADDRAQVQRLLDVVE